jgi:hypothetical protein
VAPGSSGWLELDLSPLVIDSDADDVADFGRRLLGRAEVEVFQDLPDGQRVGQITLVRHAGHQSLAKP